MCFPHNRRQPALSEPSVHIRIYSSIFESTNLISAHLRCFVLPQQTRTNSAVLIPYNNLYRSLCKIYVELDIIMEINVSQLNVSSPVSNLILEEHKGEEKWRWRGKYLKSYAWKIINNEYHNLYSHMNENEARAEIEVCITY